MILDARFISKITLIDFNYYVCNLL